MIINKTQSYAIRVLELLAQKKDILISAKKISQILNIPYKYLTRVMTKLSESQLVNSYRGKDGGFMIAKEPSEIKLKDIVDIFSNESPHQCIYGDGSICSQKTKCTLHDKWQNSKESINESFLNTTIQELLK
jgi:Rrf2 family protein